MFMVIVIINLFEVMMIIIKFIRLAFINYINFNQNFTLHCKHLINSFIIITVFNK